MGCKGGGSVRGCKRGASRGRASQAYDQVRYERIGLND